LQEGGRKTGTNLRARDTRIAMQSNRIIISEADRIIPRLGHYRVILHVSRNGKRHVVEGAAEAFRVDVDWQDVDVIRRESGRRERKGIGRESAVGRKNDVSVLASEA
jgi:hypothetical protein